MLKNYLKHNLNIISKNSSAYNYILPSLILILTFSYFPAYSAIYHSFFEWNGGDIEKFIGFENFIRAFQDKALGHSFIVILILVAANFIKMIPSITVAVVIHRIRNEKWQYIYRVLFVIPMIIPMIVWLLIWKFIFDPNFNILNKILEATGIMSLLQWLDSMAGWGVFLEGVDPAWLSKPELIVPALIIWGFPWVGVIGVLIYLSGLSAISPDVYEAAEIDGIGWFRKFWNIELPLIMTQVRLNSVLMIINTLKSYGLVLILLGTSGGPGGAGMVPGLYMFRKAFVDQEAGYACAIGLLIFALILVLTWINNKYMRVEY
jgi:raffinose/stachyose/melibiose transport system permease protein